MLISFVRFTHIKADGPEKQQSQKFFKFVYIYFNKAGPRRHQSLQFENKSVDYEYYGAPEKTKESKKLWGLGQGAAE